jgi:hypothetical protein
LFKLSRSIFCRSPRRDRSGIAKVYVARIATKESGKKTSENVQVVLQRALSKKTDQLMAYSLLFIIAIVSANPDSCAISMFPAGISFMPEMAYIPEVDDWNKASGTISRADSQKTMRSWDAVKSWADKQCTDAVVCGLSRWARGLMAAYKRSSSFDKYNLVLFRTSPDHKKFVFKSIADTLPSHSSAVSRTLTLFLLYDTSSGQITRITVTIRGERKE